jgi:hypothetical protein
MTSLTQTDSDHTLVPFQTEDAIVTAIGDREVEFTSWLVEFARDYATVVRDDHWLFIDAFRNDEIAGLHSTRQG